MGAAVVVTDNRRHFLAALRHGMRVETPTEFLAAFTDFMNGEPCQSAEVVAQALTVPSDWLYILDPRNDSPDDTDPPTPDVVGCYAVDEAGQIVPNSFQYNREHRWFCPEGGTSGLLNDRRFYDWLNR